MRMRSVAGCERAVGTGRNTFKLASSTTQRTNEALLVAEVASLAKVLSGLRLVLAEHGQIDMHLCDRRGFGQDGKVDMIPRIRMQAVDEVVAINHGGDVGTAG